MLLTTMKKNNTHTHTHTQRSITLSKFGLARLPNDVKINRIRFSLDHAVLRTFYASRGAAAAFGNVMQWSAIELVIGNTVIATAQLVKYIHSSKLPPVDLEPCDIIVLIL